MMNSTSLWRASILLARPPSPQDAVPKRTYVFLPTSWTELKLRLRQKAYPRVLKVVLKRQSRRLLKRRLPTSLRYAGARLKMNATYSWLAVRRRRPLIQMGHQSSTPASAPPLSLHNNHNNRNGGNTGTGSFRGFLSRVKYMFTGKPLRHQRSTHHVQPRTPLHQPEPFSSRPQGETSTMQVTIEDYMETSWFDKKGRPLVARDETGRFVNPWISQSADGVKPLTVLWQWRRQRLERELREFGWNFFVPTFYATRFEQTGKAPSSSSSASLDLIKPRKPYVACFPKPSRPSTLRFTWIGHATCLVQQGDVTILTDPIFSERASPFPKTPIGIARAKPAACTISELPEKIDICLISHDHYDHLDKSSVMKLRKRVGLWVVPLGTKQWMEEKARVRSDRLVELEWWESALVARNCGDFSVQRVHSLRQHADNDDGDNDDDDDDVHPASRHPPAPNELWISCLPVQHWCSRTLWDRNYRLWASFAVLFPYKQTFYFTGDTALPTQFPIFGQIRSYLPWPISLAAIPIGAYEPAILNDDSHVNPPQAVQIHRELQARQSVAIHHGSFPLSEEPLQEPAQWLSKAVAEAGLRRNSFVAIRHGESIDCPGLGSIIQNAATKH